MRRHGPDPGLGRDVQRRRAQGWRLPLTLATIAMATAVLTAATGAARGAGVDSTEVSNRPPVYQDTVVVTASKLGFRLADLASSATMISPEQLRLGTARSTQDAVAGVPGAHILDLSGSETQGAVETRGFASQGTSSHMLVLIDEMPINDLEGDRVDWGLLGLSQVTSVEFLRGPASFLYGDASMSGVVNLVTRRPGEKSNAWIQGSAGSEGRGEGSFGGSSRWRHATLGYSYSVRTLDGFRDHSHWRAPAGQGSARIPLTQNWSLRAQLLGSQEKQEVAGPLPDPLWKDDPKRTLTPEDRRDTDLLLGALELRGPAAPELESVILLSADTRETEATETIIPVGTMDRSARTRSMGAEGRLDWKPAALPIPHLLVGGDVRRGTLESRYYDRQTSGALVGAGDVERVSGGMFALVQARARERWSVTAGLRMDWLSSALDDLTDGAPQLPHDDLRAFSPTASLNLSLPRSGNAYLAYAGSFKAPTLEQLYDQRPYYLDFDGPGPQPPVVFKISNSALQPQRGENVEGGIRTALGPLLSMDAALYYTRSRDEIGFDLANFRHSNIDQSIHYGFEGALSSSSWRGLSGQLSYAYTRATFDGGAHDGRQINTVPEHQLYGRVSFAHAYRGSLTLEAISVARQWVDEDNLYRLPDYAVAHLGVTQRVGTAELFGSVRNLLDARYATLGYVTLDQLGNDLPLYFPAAGRSFQVGVRLESHRAR